MGSAKPHTGIHLPRHRLIGAFLIVFHLIIVPIYIFIGLQPTITSAAPTPHSLAIPTIGLTTGVADSTLRSDNTLTVPDTIPSAYTKNPNKTLLMGHSSTIFKNLKQLTLGATFTYDQTTYTITHITTKAKSDISMSDLLAPADTPTLILMTCAGQPLTDQDYTHRLIITATTK